VAARVQGDFDDGSARCRVDESEVVDLNEAVLEVDSGPEDGPGVLGLLTLDLGEVGLRDFVARMGQALAQLSVVGLQDDPFGLRVKPDDVEETFVTVAHAVSQGGSTL